MFFRDALRADASLAAEYAALKKRLVVTHRFDREGYTEAKSFFVRRVLDLR
ncbi:MAG: GrpB family protein [Archangium sp.]|nr:GrpB family protein [Archangium sp.]